MDTTDRYQWGSYLFRGIMLIILGVFALLLPGMTFASLVVLFAAYMLVDGIYFIVTGVANRSAAGNRVWYLLVGIVSILAAIIAFLNPFAAAAALVYFFGFWTLLSGIAAIALAISLRNVIKGEWWYILAGIVTIIFSVLILLNPLAGAITLALFFGINALVNGVLLLSLAIRLRSRERHAGHGHRGAIA